MTDSTFRVVFAGKPLPGVDRDTAIRNFAQLLKRTPEQVTGAFAGKATVIKKGLNEAEAEKYCRALEKAGLMVHAEPEPAVAEAPKPAAPAPAEAPPKPSLGSLSLMPTDDEDDAPAARPVPAPEPKAPAVEAPKISPSLALVKDDDEEEEEAPAGAHLGGKSHAVAHGMKCPACGHEQGRADVCESCGVVIAKFLQRQAAKAQAPAADTGGSAPASEEPSALKRGLGVVAKGLVRGMIRRVISGADE